MISDRDVVKPLAVAWSIKVTTFTKWLTCNTDVNTLNISGKLAKHEK